jgi:hypothetical protein
MAPASTILQSVAHSDPYTKNGFCKVKARELNRSNLGRSASKRAYFRPCGLLVYAHGSKGTFHAYVDSR